MCTIRAFLTDSNLILFGLKSKHSFFLNQHQLYLAAYAYISDASFAWIQYSSIQLTLGKHFIRNQIYF